MSADANLGRFVIAAPGFSKGERQRTRRHPLGHSKRSALLRRPRGRAAGRGGAYRLHVGAPANRKALSCAMGSSLEIAARSLASMSTVPAALPLEAGYSAGREEPGTSLQPRRAALSTLCEPWVRHVHIGEGPLDSHSQDPLRNSQSRCSNRQSGSLVSLSQMRVDVLG
jgi:hypothetical protein